MVRALVWLAVASLTAIGAFGQHPGSNMGSGPAHSPELHQHAHSPGLQPVGPLRQRPGRILGEFPFLWGGYNSDLYAPEPYVAPVPQPPAPYVIVQQAPIENVRLEIHDYVPRDAYTTEPAGEPPSFSIVLRDGTLRSAVAVTMQGDTLVYFDTDNAQQRVPLDYIDRETTRRLNREKGLNLRLPPPAK